MMPELSVRAFDLKVSTALGCCCQMRGLSVRKRVFLRRHFLLKMIHFTKTGSGQT